jgi:DivIVA domain-containing protein
MERHGPVWNACTAEEETDRPNEGGDVLTPADVMSTRFTTTWLLPGYDQAEVDAFLDRTQAGLDRLIRENEELRGGSTGIQPGGLTSADVRNAKFAVTRRRPGYDQREVDAFLARTEAEVDRLMRENEGPGGRLTGIQPGEISPRGAGSAPVPPPGTRPESGLGKAGPNQDSERSQDGKLSFGCLLVLVLFLGAIVTGAGVGIVIFHADYERSNYTQASGIPQTATVISEKVGTGKGAETQVTVRLDPPVGGRDVSVVSIAGAHVYQHGDRISILVDPQDPSYSELPGLPDDTSLEALVGCATVLLVVLLSVTGGLVSAFRKRRRRGQRSLPVT